MTPVDQLTIVKASLRHFNFKLLDYFWIIVVVLSAI